MGKNLDIIIALCTFPGCCRAATSSFSRPPSWLSCANSWMPTALTFPWAHKLKSFVAKGFGSSMLFSTTSAFPVSMSFFHPLSLFVMLRDVLLARTFFLLQEPWSFCKNYSFYKDYQDYPYLKGLSFCPLTFPLSPDFWAKNSYVCKKNFKTLQHPIHPSPNIKTLQRPIHPSPNKK